MSTRPLHAVVIGAGLGGLAAAIRLQAQGHRVTVVERRAQPGGRAYQIKDQGYTWDMGPSLITMPWLFDELYALAGTTTAQQVTLSRLDPAYRIRWSNDARVFDFQESREGMIGEIEKFSEADARAYDDFMEASRRIHEQGILVAGRRPFLEPVSFAKLVPTMLKLDAIRSLRGFVGKYFADPRVRMVFDFHSLFIGGDPWRVPAIYTALSYLQVADGVWYAEGGVYSIVESLANVIRSGGGEVLLGRRVAAIETSGKQVTGVRLGDGERIAADLVVSNADASLTRRRLLDPAVRDRVPWRWIRPRHTMSAYLLYLGTNRQFPQAGAPHAPGGRGLPGFVREVTRSGQLPDTLALYVHAPSRTEPAMAANGGESLYVLLPVPNLASGRRLGGRRTADARTGPRLHGARLRARWAARVDRRGARLHAGRLQARAGGAAGQRVRDRARPVAVGVLPPAEPGPHRGRAVLRGCRHTPGRRDPGRASWAPR